VLNQSWNLIQREAGVNLGCFKDLGAVTSGGFATTALDFSLGPFSRTCRQELLSSFAKNIWPVVRSEYVASLSFTVGIDVELLLGASTLAIEHK
jgi:hypothetical protein